MLDFHWIKAMLFFGKFYDFLQFFLHHGFFLLKSMINNIPESNK